MQGLPLLNYNSDEGFGYGARLLLIDRAEGFRPYRYSIGAQFFQTTRAISAHHLTFDAPYFLGTKNRYDLELAWAIYKFFPYYGLGNGSTYEPRFEACADREALAADPDHCAGNAGFKGLRYYRYGQQALPRIRFNLRRDLGGPWRFFAGYRFRNVRITPLYGADDLGQTGSSRLIEDARAGLLGGWDGANPASTFTRRTAEITSGIVYDTRDNEPSPTEGMFNELSLRMGSPLLGGEFQYWGANGVIRWYRWLFHRDLVWALRAIADATAGDVPFFLLGTTGGLGGPDAVGGESSVRGLLAVRAQGKVKLIANTELRWTFLSLGRFDFRVAAGLDGGRVWRELGRGDSGPIRLGGAAGLRVAWNKNFIVRFDYGIGISEPYADGNIYLTFDEAF